MRRASMPLHPIAATTASTTIPVPTAGAGIRRAATAASRTPIAIHTANAGRKAMNSWPRTHGAMKMKYTA